MADQSAEEAPERRGRSRAGCPARGIRPSPPRPTPPGRSRGPDLRSNGSSALAAIISSGGSVASEARGEGDMGPHQVDAGALELVERPGLGSAQQCRARRRTRRRGDWPARPSAPARRAAPDRRSMRPRVGGTRRRRRAPPRACARPAERSSSSATSSLGPGVARARCQARRSGSVSGSVASARAPMHAVTVVVGRRTVGGGSDERMRELDACPDLDQPGFHRRVRRRSCRDRGSRRHGGGAPRRRAAPRRRRGRAAGCRRGAGGGAARSSVRSCRPPAGCREIRTRRRARQGWSRCVAARAGRAGCRGSP